MRLLLLCAALMGSLIAGTAASAASLDQIKTLAGRACAASEEAWEENRTVETKRGDVVVGVTYHRICTFEFVAGGSWYKFDYREHAFEARSAGYVDSFRSELGLLVLLVEAADIQNFHPPLRFVVSDREARGRAIFGTRDVLGGAQVFEHFYLPAEDPKKDPLCTADLCLPVGERFAKEWQGLYDEAISRALAVSPSN